MAVWEHWINDVLRLSFAVRRTQDDSTSVNISRANSITDELDYMTENIPLPVVEAK